MHVLNILWVVFGIGLMLVLNLRFKINSMVALLLAALSVGMLAGMDLMALLHTMKSGFGSTLGELAIIVVFGAVIGKLMVDSGAAHQIAHTLLARLGLRYVQLSAVAPLEYSILLWAAALGYLFFGEMPGITTWLGGALIIASGVVVAKEKN